MNINRIRRVVPGSIAEELGVERGDSLQSINGKTVLDILDYRFRTAVEKLTIEFISPSMQSLQAEIEKEEWEDIGLEFENELLSKKRSCANHCVFCFVDQLPSNCRKTLRFKDDDWRLSFLQGNYVTLTNVSDSEIDRIIEQRITPLYISVHATDPQIRCDMMRNHRAGRLMEQLSCLATGGIDFYAQIVLCPGYNDGVVLSKTLDDLSIFRPHIRGVAIVPVGLSAYRDNLTPLRAVTPNDARDVIARISASKIKDIAFAADEIYILADAELPKVSQYNGFEMIEDGIGMLSCFREDFLNAIDERDSIQTGLVIATGECAYPFFLDLAAHVESVFHERIQVIAVHNAFFGGGVSVAGLLTGQCLRKSLSGRVDGKKVLISACMLRQNESVFLDDDCPDSVGKALNAEIEVIANSGLALYNAIIQERENGCLDH